MASKYEQLWEPIQTKTDEDFDMPWKESLDGPQWGDEEYHRSGQLLEMERAAREILAVLQWLPDEQKSLVINAWITGSEDSSGFTPKMNEFLQTRDAYRLISFWNERTSPFLFLAQRRFFSSKDQYERFVRKAYSEVGAEYRDFDELAVETEKAPIPIDWITFVK